jgi:hypothetical protein
MKILLKIQLLIATLLSRVNSKKHIHKKRVALYSLKYFEYLQKIESKMTIEEVNKLKYNLNVSSIYISPPELRKIHIKIKKYLHKK